jgi:hypothetical protein
VWHGLAISMMIIGGILSLVEDGWSQVALVSQQGILLSFIRQYTKLEIPQPVDKRRTVSSDSFIRTDMEPEQEQDKVEHVVTEVPAWLTSTTASLKPPRKK